MENNITLLIIFLLAIWSGFLFIIRKIQFFFPLWEDTNKMINTAANAEEWHWPSRMHRPDNRSTYMKDITMLMLVIFQRIFQDKKNVFPLVAMQGFTNIASAFVIFLIANIYWSLPIAWIITILFIISFWPWQISLNVGHVLIANLFFLLAVYAALIGNMATGISSLWWILIAGCLFACLVFSSASWVKYAGLFFTSLVFAANRSVLTKGDWPSFFSVFSPNQHLWLNLIVATVVLGLVLIIKLSYRNIVKLMYEDKLPRIFKKLLGILRRDMAGKNNFTLNYYLDYAEYKLKRYGLWLLRCYVLLFIVINFVGMINTFIFLAGFCLLFLLLTLPDIKKSLSFYYLYVRENHIRQKTAFRSWTEYFAKMGIHVDRHSRSGFKWIPRVLFKIIPFLVIFFYLSSPYLLIIDIKTNQYWHVFSLLVVTITAFLPIIWGELTNSPGSARNYFAGFIGILVIVGYSLNQLYQSFPNNFLTFGIFIVLAYIIWNLYNFFTDILPSRMTINNLIKTLNKLNIKEFYTYKTDYNSILIDSFRPEIQDKYKIKYIDSLNEIKDGWVLITATSHKTTPIPSEEIIEKGDMTSDPILNSLLSTKKIEKIATKKFKTFCSSKFWIQDNEVVSYHDLILHDITPDDKLRSYAWLLNIKNLQNA